MKYKLIYGVLVSALLVTMLQPTLVKATSDPQTHNAISRGQVTVEAGVLDSAGPIIDPEAPEKDINPINSEIESSATPGTLGVTNVSRLNFGTIKTTMKSIKTYAKPLAIAWGNEGGVTATRGALVQFGDARGNNGGYTMNVQMTRPFTFVGDATKFLAGATITYNHGIMETRGTNTATSGTMVSSMAPLGMSLNDQDKLVGNSVQVVEAKNGQGAGVYVLEFGQSEDYVAPNPPIIGMIGAAGSVHKAVALDVPSTTASSMTVGNYTADLTWTIIAGPTTA